MTALPDWLTNATSIAIVGFGREGQSTYKFVRSVLPAIPILILDEHWTEEKQKIFAGDSLVRSLDHAIDAVTIEEAVIFKTPGIPVSRLHLNNPRMQRLSSQADLFFELFGSQIIAITGTKGKSTASHVLTHVLKACGADVVFVGNIGTPMLDIIDSIHPQTKIVAEISSFQAESLHTSSKYAVFLNLYPEHLDYYSSLEEYVKAKQHLFLLQTKEDTCIFNVEDVTIVSTLEGTHSKKIGMSSREDTRADAYVGEEGLYWKKNLGVSRNTIQLPGAHNLYNCLPAFTLAMLFGFELSAIQAAFKTVRPLEGRLEKVATVDAITFYDDALATIPQATIAALNTLGSQVHTLIVGGHDRNQDFSELAKVIAHSSVQTLITFPTTGERIALAVKQKRAIQTVVASTMQEAVDSAFTSTPKGASVLLSTASPSFGLFTDYRDRSNQYLQCIRSHVPDQP